MNSEFSFDARIIDEDILAVVLRGSLDSTRTEEFDKKIRKHLDQGRSKIIIDCRDLEYLTSLGIGSLVALQTRLRKQGGVVKLAALHGVPAEIVKLVRLDRILDIYGDLEFARKSFYE